MLINGFNPISQQDDVRKSFGIVFQDSSLDDELTAYENMELHAVLYKIPKEKINISLITPDMLDAAQIDRWRSIQQNNPELISPYFCAFDIKVVHFGLLILARQRGDD